MISILKWIVIIIIIIIYLYDWLNENKGYFLLLFHTNTFSIFDILFQNCDRVIISKLKITAKWSRTIFTNKWTVSQSWFGFIVNLLLSIEWISLFRHYLDDFFLCLLIYPLFLLFLYHFSDIYHNNDRYCYFDLFLFFIP